MGQERGLGPGALDRPGYSNHPGQCRARLPPPGGRGFMERRLLVLARRQDAAGRIVGGRMAAVGGGDAGDVSFQMTEVR